MRERNPRSSMSGAVRSRGVLPVEYNKNLSTQNCALEGDTNRVKSNLRKAAGTLLTLTDSETTSVYSSPCGSLSESEAYTEDYVLVPDVAPAKLLRRSKYETNMRKKLVRNKNGEETVYNRKEIIKTLGMEASKSIEKVKASSLSLSGGIAQLSIQSGKLWDDTTSSLEDDSLCSSGKISENKTGWTWTCSTCTPACAEEESQQRDLSPPERPAKKSCGDRTSHQQESKERPNGWNSVEKTIPNGSYHSTWKFDGGKESVNVQKISSTIKMEDKVRIA